MVKANIILKDDNLREVLKFQTKLLLNNKCQDVTFVKETYLKDNNSNEILVLFFEIANSNDITIALNLKKCTNASCIILLSKDESLVFDALRVNPLQFIRLNNFDEDLKITIEILLDYMKNIDTVVTLRSGTATIRLNVKNIMFIESFGHYLIIHSTSGQYQVREKLSNIIEQINRPSFIRTHKSYIININFAQKVLSDKLVLKNDLEIPIGRNFKEEVMHVYRGVEY
jgi:two-component system, LytTR family, response regulator LytT